MATATFTPLLQQGGDKYRLENIKEAANQFGISTKNAVMTRLRFLYDQLKILRKEDWKITMKAEKVVGVGPVHIMDYRWHRYMIQAEGIYKELEPLNRSIARVEREIKSLTAWLNGKEKVVHPGRLSDEDIETARSVPVSLVLDDYGIKVLKNGMCKCFAHTDKNESASVTRGVLHCFAGCVPDTRYTGGHTRTSWDSVTLYRQLHDVSYTDAIRGLLSL
jgi:hypothetical protein